MEFFLAERATRQLPRQVVDHGWQIFNNVKLLIISKVYMVEPDKKLRLAFYDASDGPRIVIFGPMDADFQSMQELFRKLSYNTGPYDLDKLPFIQAFGNIRVVVSSSGSMFEEAKGRPQGLRRRHSMPNNTFEWQRTAEGWDYLAQLIDGLVTSFTPGHQYLTSYPNEDAIIVLSKGEYSDKILDEL